MGFIQNTLAKAGNSAARKNILLAVDDFHTHIKQHNYAACMKDIQDIHRSGLVIMQNVLMLEGFESGSEEDALSLISSLPRYADEFRAMEKGFLLMADLEKHNNSFPDYVNNIHEALKQKA